MINKSGKRSSVSLNTISKGVQALAPHPWIFSKLISLQFAKWIFPYRSVVSKHGDAGKIHQLSIRITDICNLRCHTCGQWGDNGFLHGKDLAELRRHEVSAARYKELFQDLVSHGHKPNIYIWGGEPTLYKNLEEVIQQATMLSLPTSIATNGHSLAKFADFFVSTPLFLLQASIDGHNPQTHNAARPATGKRDSYQDLTLGLQAVKEAKKKFKSTLPIVASLTVISQQNIKHLVDIYETYKENVDVFVFYLSWWIDKKHAQLHEADFSKRFGFTPTLHRGWLGSWKPSEYDCLAKQLSMLHQLGKQKGPAVTIIPNITSTSLLKEYYTNHPNSFGYNECISIYQAAELDSNGNMSPCRDYHDYVVGNIKEQTITELWNSTDYKKFRTNLKDQGLMPVCTRCCGLMGY